MNRFKCPTCGGNQYTSCNTAEDCIYCGNKELEKMETLELQEAECKHYVPAWDGNKTSGKQPAFCLKHKVSLYGKCLKDCREKKDVRKDDRD